MNSGFYRSRRKFLFYKKKVSNLDNFYLSQSQSNILRAEFRLSQNSNLFLLNKIKKRLKINRKVSLQSNSSNHYYIVAASSLSLQNVINFYTKPDIVKFKGIKNLKFIMVEIHHRIYYIVEC